MKLRNKLLTVLPLVTIGVSTPIAISGCSCGNSYEIKFKDSVNCKDKDNKDVKYHSIEEVKNASKLKVQPYTEEEKMEKSDLKQFSKDEEFFYWDLIYSCAIKNMEFFLTWNENKAFNEISFSSLNYDFNNSGKVAIYANETKDKEIVESYCYDRISQK